MKIIPKFTDDPKFVVGVKNENYIFDYASQQWLDSPKAKNINYKNYGIRPKKKNHSVCRTGVMEG